MLIADVLSYVYNLMVYEEPTEITKPHIDRLTI